MLVRCIESAIDGIDVGMYDLYEFADGDSIDVWARPFVMYAFEQGIMRGVGGNMIDPLGITTCEQAILLVYRVYDNFNGPGDRFLSDLTYKGIEISLILVENPESVLGKPLDTSEGPYLDYEGLDIYYNGVMQSMQCTKPGLLDMNGVSLDMTRAEFIKAFGDPVDYYIYSDYTYYASDDVNVIRYHVEAYITDYIIEVRFTSTNLNEKPYSIAFWLFE